MQRTFALSARKNLVITGIAFSLLLIVSGGILILHYGRTYTNVGHIRVAGNGYLSSGEIIEIAAIPNSSFTRSDLFSARHRILAHPAVEDASLDMEEESGSIIIRVRERMCLAVLRVDGSLVDIDETGRVLFYDGRCSAAPLLSGPFRVSGGRALGENLSEVTGGLAGIRNRMPEIEKRISEVYVHKSHYTLFMQRPAIQVEMQDLGEQSLARLTASLAYFEREGRSRGRIDLRGKNALYLPAT